MIYYKLTFILLHLQLLISISAESSDSNNDGSCPKEKIFDSNVKEGVFNSPGFPLKYCGSLDCKWNIQSAENTFIYAKLKSFETEENYDTLDVYQTRLNGSELMKVKQASLGKRYINSPCIHFSSPINGGLFFHYYTKGLNHTHSGFEIKFSRKSEDKSFLILYCN
uniref:CUB domain-containing protein n=1 Tax=Meloidogyne enterolobii TaxID=390850 RepID=A0A6V7TT96_MELEN|nr:unnamed protein product [Meloidogyne enterolobii]